jgi:hypothetical protein
MKIGWFRFLRATWQVCRGFRDGNIDGDDGGAGVSGRFESERKVGRPS